MLKKILIVTLTLATIFCLIPLASVFGARTNVSVLTQKELEKVIEDERSVDDSQNVSVSRTKNSKSYNIPNGKGTLTSNAWRSSFGKPSGNTYQWDYQVSAFYSGKYAVSSIRTIWRGAATLRNSASINLGISNTGVSVGASSSWQNMSTVTKYWENTNGAKESDYRSNMVVAPKKDYRKGTISLINTARVKLSKDAKHYDISASC